MQQATQVFDNWQSAAASRPIKPISPKSAKHYRGTWLNWLLWLAPPVNWTNATVNDVHAYLQQIQPSSLPRLIKNHRPLHGPSDVTLRRYWRQLRDIYNHAVLLETCPHNPCIDVPDVPRTEIAESMILPPWALSQLMQHILQRHQPPNDVPWRQLRNDVLLLLLCLSAMKCSEIVGLRPHQVTFMQATDAQPCVVILVQGDRKNQNRSILIHHPRFIYLLKKWISIHAQIDNAPPELFFGAKTKTVNLKKIHTPLSLKTVFILVSQALAEALPQTTFEASLAHVGPETIRNTVISSWLAQGMSLEDVMQKAGVAEMRAIYRLDQRQCD